MNLIIDIGNTQAKLAVFDGDCPVEEVRTSNETLEALPQLLSRYTIKYGIVSSVINLSAALEMLLASLPFPVIRFNSNTRIPLKNDYRTPQTLGVDRLAAVVGAMTQKPDTDLLVIDAGTCITYELIESNGHYRGGNISPGLHMRLQALNEHTAKLPLVEAEGETPLVGWDTETAIRSGVRNGIKLEIEGYIQHLREKYPSLLVFLTGGDHFDFDTPIKSIIFVDEYLVPRGLNRILQYNI